MPVGALPLPADLVAAVGDFKTALKDVKRELRDVERQAASAMRKGGAVDYALLERRGELMGRETTLSGALTEQKTQAAFDKRIDRWVKRKSAATTRLDAGDVGNVRNIYGLARGQYNLRNVAGAVELATKLKSVGARGVGQLLKNAPKAVSRMLGLGEMGLALGPLAFGSFAVNQLQGAYELGDEAAAIQSRGNAQLRKAITDPSRRESFRRALIESSDVGRRGSFDDRIRASGREYVKSAGRVALALDNPTAAAAVLKQNAGIEVAGERSQVEAALAQLGAEGFLDEALLMIELRVKVLGGQGKAQAEYFSANPTAAGKFHDQARAAARLERDRAAHGVRGW
jgi:hypothetical protein